MANSLPKKILTCIIGNFIFNGCVFYAMFAFISKFKYDFKKYLTGYVIKCFFITLLGSMLLGAASCHLPAISKPLSSEFSNQPDYSINEESVKISYTYGIDDIFITIKGDFNLKECGWELVGFTKTFNNIYNEQVDFFSKLIQNSPSYSEQDKLSLNKELIDAELRASDDGITENKLTLVFRKTNDCGSKSGDFSIKYLFNETTTWTNFEYLRLANYTKPIIFLGQPKEDDDGNDEDDESENEDE